MFVFEISAAREVEQEDGFVRSVVRTRATTSARGSARLRNIERVPSKRERRKGSESLPLERPGLRVLRIR